MSLSKFDRKEDAQCLAGSMQNFSLDQRWTSEGEPELGIGIVIETTKNIVKIHDFADRIGLFNTCAETGICAGVSSK